MHAVGDPVPLPTGGADLYIRQDKFHDQFAADVPEADTRLAAATQRPVSDASLNEPSGDPAWKTISSWFVYGDKDLAIPAQAHAFMAQRAHSMQTVVVHDASHVVMISQPAAVAKVIGNAAMTK